MKTGKKTTETNGHTQSARKFKHVTVWNEDSSVNCHFVTYLPTENIGSITMYFRKDVTTAEAWRYITTGKSDRKLLAT